MIHSSYIDTNQFIPKLKPKSKNPKNLQMKKPKLIASTIKSFQKKLLNLKQEALQIPYKNPLNAYKLSDNSSKSILRIYTATSGSKSSRNLPFIPLINKPLFQDAPEVVCLSRRLPIKRIINNASKKSLKTSETERRYLTNKSNSNKLSYNRTSTRAFTHNQDQIIESYPEKIFSNNKILYRQNIFLNEYKEKILNDSIASSMSSPFFERSPKYMD